MNTIVYIQEVQDKALHNIGIAKIHIHIDTEAEKIFLSVFFASAFSEDSFGLSNLTIAGWKHFLFKTPRGTAFFKLMHEQLLPLAVKKYLKVCDSFNHALFKTYIKGKESNSYVIVDLFPKGLICYKR